MYYLGIDIGTTSAKCVAFSQAGEVLASDSTDYEMFHPQPAWSEQDPLEVFKAVLTSSNNVLQQMKNESPLFVSFSAAMHGLLVVDKENRPLTNYLIWADNRAAEIAERLRESDWGREVYHATGVPVHAMTPLCKILWIKENEPTLFNEAYKFISIKEYIFYILFGEYIVDTSIASATGLLNIQTLSWDEPILNNLEITPSSLSQVVSTKATRTYQKRRHNEIDSTWLMPDGTVFVIGASDGALANFGCGATDDKAMAVSIGTSGAARIIVDRVETDYAMRTFCYHVKDNAFIIGGPSNNGAVVLAWLKNNLLESQESFDDLFQKAYAIAAGAEELIFIPYVLGERAPIWNSKARGVFFGLTINHTKAHLVRACMEGIIFSVYSIARLLFEKREVTRIYATGGFVNSPLWLQMLADTCNIPVVISGAVESSALGAVMLGLEAMDLSPFPPRTPLAMYEPIFEHHEIYAKNFARFERIYELLKQEFYNETMSLSHMQ